MFKGRDNSMSSIVYKRATTNDLSKIVAMKIAMFEETGNASLLSEDSEKLVLEDYERLYGLNKATHFLASLNDSIISCTGAFLKSDLPYRYFKPSKYGFIGDVYTYPEKRRLGATTELNKMAIAWLKTQGVTTVRLLATNAGRKIYERMGFVPSDEMVLRL
jgi:predicted GNAT family N-acyltransferase